MEIEQNYKKQLLLLTYELYARMNDFTGIRGVSMHDWMGGDNALFTSVRLKLLKTSCRRVENMMSSLHELKARKKELEALLEFCRNG